MKIPVFACVALTRKFEIDGPIEAHTIVGGSLNITSRFYVKYQVHPRITIKETPNTNINMWVFYDIKKKEWFTGDEMVDGEIAYK